MSDNALWHMTSVCAIINISKCIGFSDFIDLDRIYPSMLVLLHKGMQNLISLHVYV